MSAVSLLAGIFSVLPRLLAKCRAHVRRGPRKSSACNVSIVRISSLFRNGSRRFSFSCASGVQPITECLQSVEINQSPNDMLITAMRHRDEFHNLKKTTPDPNTLLQRLAPSFEWPRDAEQELKPLAERIWNYTNDRRFTINELFRQNAVCELKIYIVVSEMLRIGQIATVHPMPQLAKAS